MLDHLVTLMLMTKPAAFVYCAQFDCSVQGATLCVRALCCEHVVATVALWCQVRQDAAWWNLSGRAWSRPYDSGHGRVQDALLAIE